MRIAFISAHNFSIPGGVRTHILNLSARLEAKGHETIIIAPKKTSHKTPFNRDLENLYEIGRSIHVPMNGAVGDISFFTNQEVYDILDEHNIDLLHFHNFLPFISSDALMLAGERKKIITIHTLPAGMSERLVNKETLSKLLLMFDHTIFVSKSQSKLYKDLDVPYSVIPNGITVNPTIKPKNLDNKKIKLLYVGRIEPRKGLDYLLRAYKIVYKKNPNVELHIVGSGDLELFKKEQGLSGLDKTTIKYHGRVSDIELERIRKESDVYISPAIMGESFGIVLLEAMAFGIPVVAFNNSGYKTVLKGKLSWGLTKNKDYTALAEKISELINNPKLYNELSKLGLSEVKKYSWESIAENVDEVYQSTVLLDH